MSSYTLVVEENRILLCRLSPQLKDVGKWTLPGGGLEFGEHPEEGAVRETLEETGLHVRLSGLALVDAPVFALDHADMHAIRFIYRCEVTGGEIRDEVDGSTDLCAWFTREEADAAELVDLARIGVDLGLGG